MQCSTFIEDLSLELYFTVLSPMERSACRKRNAEGGGGVSHSAFLLPLLVLGTCVYYFTKTVLLSSNAVWIFLSS